MIQFKNSSEFVKALLTQEPALNPPTLAEHRRQLLDRLAAAERRERLGRSIVLGTAVIVIVAFSVLWVMIIRQVVDPNAWPDWAVYALALVIVLLPFSALLLTATYFFRHRRELHRARNEVYRSALTDLPRQIEELRHQLEGLRQQLPQSSTSAPKPGDQGAFTLTELLVSIAILGLLTSLLFPALSQAKAQARLVVCKSNLSQIGKALIMYEGETGSYPGAGLPVQEVDRLYKTRTTDSWDMRLFPLLANSSDVFSCPSFQPRFETGIKVDAYGYNAWGGCYIHDFSKNLGLGSGMTNAERPYVRSSEVRSPADMVAIGDLQMPPGVWINTITPNLSQTFGGLRTAIADRHRRGASMVFCDGHVEFAKQVKWIAATGNARQRWNNDNAPHPETWLTPAEP